MLLLSVLFLASGLNEEILPNLNDVSEEEVVFLENLASEGLDGIQEEIALEDELLFETQE